MHEHSKEYPGLPHGLLEKASNYLSCALSFDPDKGRDLVLPKPNITPKSNIEKNSHLSQNVINSTLQIIDGQSPEVFPLWRKRNALASPNVRREVLHQWEGVVTEVLDDAFRARIKDLTDRDAPMEVVEILMDEVSEEDRPLLGESSVFYWNIFYERSKGGQLRRVSEIRCRRLPKVTVRGLARAKEKATRLWESMNDKPKEPPQQG